MLNRFAIVEHQKREVVGRELPVTAPATGSKHTSRMGLDMQNAKRPLGFSTRDASATVFSGGAKTIAPWSQKTMSNDSLLNLNFSALPCTRRRFLETVCESARA